VLLSISGGEHDDNLEASVQDSLLFDMMEMTNHLIDAWLITDGSCRGFAKTVGHYRSKYAVTTPLIGICTAPGERMAGRAGGDPSRSNRSQAWMENIDATLDRNHSHFILASNVDKSAPQQLAQLRSNFEACVGQNQEWPAVQEAIHTTLVEHDLEWPEDLESGGKKHASSQLPSQASDIPVVHVCVQGGSEAIRTMLNTVMVSLPVLLVRGTGKATDLVADCVCLKFPPGFRKHLDRCALTPPQRRLFDLLEHLRALAGETLPTVPSIWKYLPGRGAPGSSGLPAIDSPSGHGFTGILRLLRSRVAWDLLGEEAHAAIHRQVKAVLGAYGLASGDGSDDARKVLVHVLLIAKTKFCWVYDLDTGPVASARRTDRKLVEAGLERASDFPGSLLHCLLNGVEHSSPDQVHKLHRQLRLAIKWERPDALHWLLRKHAAKMERGEFDSIVNRYLQVCGRSSSSVAAVEVCGRRSSSVAAVESS